VYTQILRTTQMYPQQFGSTQVVQVYTHLLRGKAGVQMHPGPPMKFNRSGLHHVIPSIRS
jgi:hypothetical protein